MPEVSTQLIVFVVCVGLFTTAAAVWDTRTRRIPNKLTLPMFLLGLVYQVVFNGWSRPPGAGIGQSGLASALLAFAVGFGTLFMLWLVGGGGGGDAKLMGALSVWLGFRMTLLVMIVSTLFVLFGTVGVILCSLIARGHSRTRRKYLAIGQSRDPGDKPAAEQVNSRRNRRVMAYALPVALATWLLAIWKMPFVH